MNVLYYLIHNSVIRYALSHRIVAAFVILVGTFAGSATVIYGYQQATLTNRSSEEKAALQKNSRSDHKDTKKGISAAGGAQSDAHSAQQAQNPDSAKAQSSQSAATSSQNQSSNAQKNQQTGTGAASPSTKRDIYKQPFASSSIWNMPIGSNAQYVAANLPANPGSDAWTPMPQIDDEQIILHPESPLTPIYYSNVGWSGGNRCTATGGLIVSVPVPTNFIVANSRDNNSAAILLADGRTVVQTQPFTRCAIGGIATSIIKFTNVDIYGDGLDGAHGGSRMSALGGSIRIGELRPGQTGMRHAIKLNVNAPQALYKCTKEADCFRWPALTSDAGSVGNYGSQTNNQNQAMKMGALLALRPSVNINAIGLESAPGRQIAWTLQNYGTYIVDSTGGPAYAFSAENGPDGSMRAQFKADYGYDFEQRINSNTAWSRDIQRLMPLLYVVNNNSPGSIGGGGTPLQPLAPGV